MPGHIPCRGARNGSRSTWEAADDPAQFTYLCPETYRRRGLPARDAAVYTINTDKFLNSLAALFAIPEGLRQASPAPALDGQLWHLGKPRIGPTYFDVWFGRGLAKGVADIFQHFAAPAAPDQGLLVHAGLALPELIRPPRAYRTITLPEGLVASAPLATLDQEHLYRLLTAPGAHRPQRTLPVHYDPHTQQLTLRSMPQPWLIKGRRQAAAVAHMFKQAEQERWWLKAEEILQAAYPPGTTLGRSARMQNLFRGNEEWELYIDNPKKGYYGFRIA